MGGATANNLSVRIGAMHWTDAYHQGNDRLNGKADEVEFFSRALSADEIAAIYNAGSAGKCRPCTPPPSGLVSWWGGDNNALDIVGTNNGTLMNGATYGAGKVGQAFSFDGVDDYVNVPTLTTQNFPSSFTMGAWVKANVLPGSIAVLAGMPGGYQLDLLSDGGIYFGNSGAMVYSNTKISSGSFYHVAASFDAGNVKIYINGIPDQVGTSTNRLGTDWTFQIGGFGVYDGPPTGFFQGVIDELEVYDRALTADEISAIYNAGSAGQCPIRYYVTAKATGNGAGTVRSNVGGVNYTYPGIATGTTSALNHGTGVTLTAAASTGSTVSWTTCTGTSAGNGTNQATCTYTGLNGNKVAEATFTLNTYTVTANAQGNGAGTVQSNVGGVSYGYPGTNTGTTSALNHGMNVVLTATASTGSTVSWTTCTGTASGNETVQATCTYASLDGNKTAAATFTLNTYAVTANAQGNGAGTVQSNVGGVSYNYPTGSTGTTSALNHGMNVVLTATASAGSTVAWTTCTGTASGNGTAQTTCTYSSLDGNKTAAATFTLNTYAVTANAQGNGAGTVQSNVGDVSYNYPTGSTGTTSALNHGTNVMLTATASTGSTVAWTTCTGTASGNGTASATCTYASLDGNKTSSATFTLNTYNMTVTPSGTGSGTVTGNGLNCSWNGSSSSGTCSVSLAHNTAVSLTASSEYRFDLQWLERGQRLGRGVQRGGGLCVQHYPGFEYRFDLYPEKLDLSAFNPSPLRRFSGFLPVIAEVPPRRRVGALDAAGFKEKSSSLRSKKGLFPFISPNGT